MGIGMGFPIPDADSRFQDETGQAPFRLFTPTA